MPKLKIAINARLLAAPNVRGWNRYTVNLLAALPAQGVELFLYSDAELSPEHLARLPAGSYQVRVAPPMKYLRWEQRWLPAQCAVDGVDVLHSPFNFGLPWSSECPRVLTLHDAIDRRAGLARLIGILDLEVGVAGRQCVEQAATSLLDLILQLSDVLQAADHHAVGFPGSLIAALQVEQRQGAHKHDGKADREKRDR